MNKKILSLILTVLMIFFIFSGCASGKKDEDVSGATENQNQSSDNTDSSTAADSGDKSEPADINVAVLKGPTGMGMAKLMEDSANGDTANNYTFTVSSDTSQVVADVINGTYDIAALPTNSAAMVYNKTEGGIKLLAINTLGVLYMLQNTAESEAITSVEELRGKTVCTFGQGANPEYVLNYILTYNGLTPGEDIFIDYKASVDEVLALAASGDCEFVMLPEPNVTVAISKNSDYAPVLDLTKEWEGVTHGKSALVMGCLVVSAEFAEKEPEALNEFLEEYRNSVAYVNSEPEAASELVAKFEIVPSAAIALKAIPNSHMVCITGSDMPSAVSGYYEILFEANPQSVGGAVPDEGFYYLG